MSDELRARIIEALNTAVAARVRDDPAIEPESHDKHHYYAFCALCRGEAETLADAVVAVLDQLAVPDVR